MTIQIQNEIKRITDTIVKEYQPEKIILFGSYAWGKPTKSSDVDFFLIKKSNIPRRTRAANVYKIIRNRQLPVDVIVYNPVELKEKLSFGDFFTNRIVNEGKILYERKKVSHIS